MKIIINEIPPSNNKFMGNSNSYHIYGKLKETMGYAFKTCDR